MSMRTSYDHTVGNPMAVPDVQAVPKPPKPPKTSTAYKPDNGNGEIAPIAHFNKNHSHHVVLTKFGYKLTSNGDYLPPKSKSGNAGVKILIDENGKKVAYSHNNSCPLNDGKAHDAYDCEMILSGRTKEEMHQYACSFPVNPNDPNSLTIDQHNKAIYRAEQVKKSFANALATNGNSQSVCVAGTDYEQLVKSEFPEYYQLFCYELHKECTTKPLFEASKECFIWESAYRSISLAFVNEGNGRYRALNSHNKLPNFLESRFVQEIRRTEFGAWFDHKRLSEATEGVTALNGSGEPLAVVLYKAANRIYANYMVTHRQRSRINYVTDIHSSEAQLVVTADNVTVSVPHKPFLVDHEYDTAIAQDWLLHNPEYNTQLNLLVAARVASDRKKAFFLHTAISDYGKGFQTNVWKALGISVEMNPKELARACSGDPLGIEPEVFMGCWCLVFNEVKYFPDGLKELENSIFVTPKHGMRSEIAVYTKLVTSKDLATSIGGDGVEDHYSNRMSTFNTPKDACKLSERPLFKEDPDKYFKNIVDYTAHYLNIKIAFYQVMGKSRAGSAGAKVLNDYNLKNNIGIEYGDIDDYIPELVSDLRDRIIEANKFGGDRESKLMQLIASSITEVTYQGENALLLQYGNKIISEFINETIDRSELVKLSHKKADIRSMLDESDRDDKNNPVRITLPNGENNLKKGVIIMLNK